MPDQLFNPFIATIFLALVVLLVTLSFPSRKRRRRPRYSNRFADVFSVLLAVGLLGGFFALYLVLWIFEFFVDRHKQHCLEKFPYPST